MHSIWDELPTDSETALPDIGKPDVALGRLSTGRVWGMMLVGFLVSLCILLLIGGLYTRLIRFPKEEERVWEESRLYAIENFCEGVNTSKVDIEGSYLMQELPYANGNSFREEFMGYVLKSVGYTSDKVNKKNIYGNDYIDPDTLDVVLENSWVQPEEEVTVNIIDYDSISFESSKVSELVNQFSLTADDIRYSDKLTDMYCQYICGIPKETLPTLAIRHIPFLESDECGYSVTLEEDIFLDKLLFSSNALYRSFERFADSVAKAVGTPLEVAGEYIEWGKLPEQSRESVKPPVKYGKYSIQHIWCGSYYLREEYNPSEAVKPQLGDGSKEQPASLGTPVITYVLQSDVDGNLTKLPIRVTMKEFGVSQKAINWFETKDIQNRGYNLSSEVQYCYYVFEVTNLSKETLTIKDNSALCDSSANSSGRTGTVYGLQDSVTLEPEESGIVESWNKSTELNHKYVIWGNDFARKESPVWFRVLSGDLEDPTEEKGVYLNTTRG